MSPNCVRWTREASVSDEGSIDWSLATFEGVRRMQQAEFRALPLREKIRILEEMQQVVAALTRSVQSDRGQSDGGGTSAG